ncbi:hypothetical protein T492DRAFT_1090423, partial [Pavlovales sp. CCMP2436]|mmetsp:Transcript_33413/g.78499  ORF Transcript_33413/g.78499 Transcript_33413/m.78499 type:complete len:182 (-) Transcript_33413:42-587(-)
MADAQLLRQLFGGAMEVGGVPALWLDTGQYMDIARRPVPDSQEVFVEPLADGDVVRRKPDIVFIDLQEMADVPTVVEAAWQHVEDILDRMEEAPAQRDAFTVAPAPTPRAVARDDPGAAAAAVEIPFGASQRLTVCVVRVPRASVDIVLSRVRGAGDEASQLDLSAVCASLRVLDWGLFAK